MLELERGWSPSWGQPSSASPSTVHVLLLLLWVLRPTAPSRCQPRGGEAPSPKRELDPQNRLCCRSGRRPRTFVPPRAAIGIHTQIPFPCMGIRAARSPVFCPCCAWGAMVSPAEPSCNVEHKRSALHRWLGLGLLPTPPLQTVPKLALVLSRSSRGQDAQNAHSCSQCPTLRCLGFWSQRCSGFPYERHSEQTAKSRTDLCLEDAKDLAFVCH